ncbi:MAG: M48 family metallopeptidase [Kiritimatiellia bacterium]
MIWEQIAANRRRSAVLIALLALLLCLMGIGIGEALVPGGGGFAGLIAALLILGIQYAIYATQPAALLLHSANVVELKREDSPQLFNVVEEMKLASGLSFTPRIYLIDDPAPNAFAMGRNEKDAIIAVTSGLLYRLNRDELQGVIGHEIGHLRNRDVQFITLAALMLGTIVILAEIIWHTTRYGGRIRSRSSSRGTSQVQALLLLVGLVLAIVAPLVAQLLYFACSRKREYLADACSAQFTRYPEGLASALEKISATPRVSFANKATAPMFIINPLAARGGLGLFSTHPPTAERIRILRSMAGASLLDYEAAFRASTGKGLIGDRSLSQVQAQSIREASEPGPSLYAGTVRDAMYQGYGYIPLHCSCGMEFVVPRSYERREVRCTRCGAILPLSSPSAQ